MIVGGTPPVMETEKLTQKRESIMMFAEPLEAPKFKMSANDGQLLMFKPIVIETVPSPEVGKPPKPRLTADVTVFTGPQAGEWPRVWLDQTNVIYSAQISLSQGGAPVLCRPELKSTGGGKTKWILNSATEADKKLAADALAAGPAVAAVQDSSPF